jgi:hypothetical protein
LSWLTTKTLESIKERFEFENENKPNLRQSGSHHAP